jgi:DivIVA domain-containing protein
MLTAADFDLVDFGPPSRRQQGYDAAEVDRFLELVRAAIGGAETLTAADLKRVRFAATPWGTGYNQLEVDDFLAEAARTLTAHA